MGRVAHLWPPRLRIGKQTESRGFRVRAPEVTVAACRGEREGGLVRAAEVGPELRCLRPVAPQLAREGLCGVGGRRLLDPRSAPENCELAEPPRAPAREREL